MDAVANDLLVYAKALCFKAEEEQRHSTVLGNMSAIKDMQDAVEQSMLSIIREKGIHLSSRDTFGELRKAINDHFRNSPNPITLPLNKEMDFLNTTRGKVKHHASVPSDADTARCVIYGRDFLEQICPLFFGIALDDVSRCSCVSNAEVRRRFQMAESEIRDGHYLNALISVQQAYHESLPQAVSNNILIEASLGGVEIDLRDSSDPIARLAKHVHHLTQTVGYLVLGMDVVRLKRLYELLPFVEISNFWRMVYLRKGVVASREVAEEALSLTLDVVLKSEAKGISADTVTALIQFPGTEDDPDWVRVHTEERNQHLRAGTNLAEGTKSIT